MSLRTIYSRVPTGLRQSFLMVFGNAAGQVFSAVSLILITRALGPTQFGQFIVGFALLLILVRLNDLGMTFAVQKYGAQAESHADANKIFSYTLKIKLLGALAIILIGIFFSAWLTEFLNFDQPIIIYLAFFLSSATVLYEQLQASLQSLQRFGQSVFANFFQAIVKVLGAVVLVVSTGSLSSTAVAVSQSATIAIFSLYMLAPAAPVIIFRKLVPDWVSLNLKQNFTQQKTLIKSMATHSAIGFIAAGIIENIDILFVQGYLNTYEAGLLGGVSRIALLITMMAYSLGTVLNPRVARYRLLPQLQSYWKKAWLVALASVVGFLAFIPFAGPSIQFTIGPEYTSGSSVLIILMAASFLTIAVMPFIAMFFSYEVPWYFSVAGVLQLILVIGGNWLFVPEYGLEAAAWTRLITRLILFIFTVSLAYWAHRRFKSAYATGRVL